MTGKVEFHKIKKLKTKKTGNLEVLVVAITPPLPQNSGGAKGIAQTIIPLSNEINYHLLLVGDGSVLSTVNDNIELYEKYFCSITVCKREEPTGNFVKRFCYYFKRSYFELPFLNINFYTDKVIKIIKKIIDANEIKVIEAHTTHVAFVKKFFPEIPSVLLTQNIESDLFWMNEFNDNKWRKLRHPLLSYYAKKSNRNAIKVELENKFSFEYMTFVTNEDMSRVRNCDNKLLLTLGYDINKGIKKQKTNGKYNVLWLGTFDWFPNVEGMRWFIREVYPLFQKRATSFREDIVFHIVGNNPPNDIKRMNSDTFKVYGFVDDIDTILKEADISIAPIVNGGGIKTKVVECMINRIPILGTSAAFIGTDVHHNVSAFIADEPETFATELIRSYLCRENNELISNNAYEIAKTKFDIQRFIEVKKNIYNGLK